MMNKIHHLAAYALLTASLSLAPFATAWSHAFPDHESPGAGAQLATPPASVRIRFNGDIEPVFSTLRVTDTHGRQIAKAAAAKKRSDPKLLEVKLPKLAPGSYHVWWSVVARDGHHTEGDYTFTVQ
jgi:methionine-rich copper-binding protein CopC